MQNRQRPFATIISRFLTPFDYEKVNRMAGGPDVSRSLVESVRLHKKLFLTEMDQPPVGTDLYPGSGDPAHRAETLAVLWRNSLEILSRGMGLWFYDHRITPAGF